MSDELLPITTSPMPELTKWIINNGLIIARNDALEEAARIVEEAIPVTMSPLYGKALPLPAAIRRLKWPQLERPADSAAEPAQPEDEPRT